MINVSLRGLDNLQRTFRRALLAKPMRRFFDRAAIAMQSAIRPRAPVDAGHLRNAVTYEVDGGEIPKWAKVGVLNAAEGSPLWFKARAMEYGTARRGDPDVSHKKSHFPPAAALDRWARRNAGTSGFQIARAIGLGGGLKPRRYLREGADAATPEVERMAGDIAADVAAEYNKQD